MDQSQKAFLNSVKKTAKKNNIKITFVDASIIKGMNCTGYFDEVDLKVAKKRSFDSWFKVFIHESCHMDQFLEKSPYWNKKIRGTLWKHDYLSIYELYVDRIVNDIDKTIAEQMLTQVVGVEWDCEKRSVQKILDNNLGFDTKQYIKEANLYCYLYPFCFQERKWSTLSRICRNNKNIYNYVSDEFLKSPRDYINIPVDLYEQMLIGVNKRKEKHEETYNTNSDSAVDAIDSES